MDQERSSATIGDDEAQDRVLPRLLGGVLCLDFANTIDDRTGSHPADYLRVYADLARWGRHAGQLDQGQLTALLAEARRRPDAARAVFAGAIALREAIYRVFAAIAHDERPAGVDLETIQRAHLAALERARLDEVGGGIGWVWREDEVALERVTWPVGRSAVDLLTGAELDRVKQCPGTDGDCGWLFLDASRNASRRWCSMEGCGSQAKMRRLYARRRGGERRSDTTSHQ
jgi:predicted RNA-binding Zn ribbon-like protein